MSTVCLLLRVAEFGHPKDHFRLFRGWMHASGYAGFEIYCSGHVREVARRGHVRRKFVGIHLRYGPPIAEEATGQIVQLCVGAGGSRVTAWLPRG